MKKVICLVFAALLPVVGPVSALEQFDSSAALPALVEAAKSASISLRKYRKANKQAEAAAQKLAGRLRGIPVDLRDEEKARLYVELEQCLNVQAATLANFYTQMERIQGQIESGMIGRMTETREKLAGIVGEFKIVVEEKLRTANALAALNDLDPEAMSNEQGREIVRMYGEVNQRRAIAAGLEKKVRRITAIQQTISAQLENIRAMTSAVDARLSEVRAESELIHVLQDVHKVEIIGRAAGVADANGKLNLAGFNSTTSSLIDTFIATEETPAAADSGSWKQEFERLREGKRTASSAWNNK